MKTNKHFRLSDEAVRILDELSVKTGKTQTQIIEEALKLYQTKEYEENAAIELLTKENEKMKLIISTLQITLQEKDKKYEDMRNTYEHMLNNIKKNYDDMKANYEDRIGDLKKIIENYQNEQKNNMKSRSWWKFWNNKK